MAKMRFGVVVFPGSNCDHDAQYALEHTLGQEARFLWHKESSIGDLDVIILPGGFSYGDYLRCGAIARFSPIMQQVIEFAEGGGTVVGICNGFQILCESGLLPGALLRNDCLTFVCKDARIRVENQNTRFTSRCSTGEILRVPVAHGEGNYHVDDDTLRVMESRGQILFRYCTEDGSVTAAANPNGSRSNIAGIMNGRGNVMGMMPHPERACDPLLGSIDGQKIFASLAATRALQDHFTDTLIA